MLPLITLLLVSLDMLTSLQGAYTTLSSSTSDKNGLEQPTFNEATAARLLMQAAQRTSPFAFKFIEGDASSVKQARLAEAKGRRDEARRTKSKLRQLRKERDLKRAKMLCAQGQGPCESWCNPETLRNSTLMAKRGSSSIDGSSSSGGDTNNRSWASICSWHFYCCGCSECVSFGYGRSGNSTTTVEENAQRSSESLEARRNRTQAAKLLRKQARRRERRTSPRAPSAPRPLSPGVSSEDVT